MIYLFDIDGTLLLSGGAGSRALNRVFHDRYRIDGAMDAIRPAGKTDPMIIEEIFETRLGRVPSEDELAEVIDAYVPELRVELADSPRFRLMPSVVEVLDHFATLTGVTLGIATGNVRIAAEAKLERGELHSRFVVGGYGCDHRERRHLVARAIERARQLPGRATVEGGDVVVVGDTPYDIAAAKAVGARVVAVATGSSSLDELLACQPDAAFASLAELPDWHERQVG